MEKHNYSLSELEDMLPWERQVYVSLLVQMINQEEEND
jgi:hypothetical protein